MACPNFEEPATASCGRGSQRNTATRQQAAPCTLCAAVAAFVGLRARRPGSITPTAWSWLAKQPEAVRTARVQGAHSAARVAVAAEAPAVSRLAVEPATATLACISAAVGIAARGSRPRGVRRRPARVVVSAEAVASAEEKTEEKAEETAEEKAEEKAEQEVAEEKGEAADDETTGEKAEDSAEGETTEEVPDAVAEATKERDAAKNEVDEMLDKFLRLQASLQNYRRQHETDMKKAESRGLEDTFRKLVRLDDQIEACLNPSVEEMTEGEKALQDSYSVLFRKMRDLWEKFKVTRLTVEVGDTFEPSSMIQVETEEVTGDATDGAVVKVIKRGWQCDRSVILLSEVAVARKPEEPEEAADEEKDEEEVEEGSKAEEAVEEGSKKEEASDS